ncbi:MAG: ArdC family protein, partial [Bryobacteraceae bacterium]
MTPDPAANESTPEKRDHRREVTDSIIKMLEEGVAPWQKPWKGAAMPFNPTTDRAYRGGNALHLLATGIARGSEDPRWLTYKQATEQGWQVHRGEKGTHIEFWDVLGGSNGKSAASDSEKAENSFNTPKERRFIRRVYTVFNAKQIEGIPAYTPKERTPFEIAENGERILANSGARIAHDQRDGAFYHRSSDSIHLPAKDSFKDAPGYYGTALHELAHWTGHPSRLNRSTLTESYRFGDLNYAKEELRAELASVFLAAEIGVSRDPANHAAYVDSWITALRKDKNEIFRAAHDASVAADFVLTLERDVSRAMALETTALESPAQELSSPECAGVQEARLRDEAETLQYDRDAIGEPVSPADSNGSNGTGSHGRASADIGKSLTAAERFASQSLGESTRTFVAQVESGRYKGQIIGETEHHLIQRLSAQSAVVHKKELFDPIPQFGQHVAISYADGKASVKKTRERAK